MLLRVPRAPSLVLVGLILVYPTRVRAQGTDAHLAADSLYREGLALMNEGKPAAHERAITSFLGAIAAEDDFAPAYVALSKAYRLSKTKYGGPPSFLDAAIAFGEKAVFLAPDDAEAQMALGRAYHAKQWYRQALPHIQRAEDLAPSVETAFWLGWMGCELGKEGMARHEFELAFRRDTSATSLHLYLGYVNRVLGDERTAEEELQQAVQVDPADIVEAQTNFVLLLLTQGEDEAAWRRSEAFLAKAPDDADRLALAGTVRWYTGDLAEARRLLQRAVEAKPEVRIEYWDGYALTALGAVLWKMGDKAGARRAFDQAITGYDKRLHEAGEGWGYHYDLARIYAVLGERERAYRWLRKAVDLGWPEVYLGRRDPMMVGLRGDAEYKQLMSSVEERLRRSRQEVGAGGR